MEGTNNYAQGRTAQFGYQARRATVSESEESSDQSLKSRESYNLNRKPEVLVMHQSKPPLYDEIFNKSKELSGAGG